MYNNTYDFSISAVASAPSNLMAVQEGPTSIRVSWSPPTPLGDTTGYRISYSGGSSGSVDVSDGSADNFPLTCLENGASYTISIVGTSQHLPSMGAMITLGETTELQYSMCSRNTLTTLCEQLL